MGDLLLWMIVLAIGYGFSKGASLVPVEEGGLIDDGNTPIVPVVPIAPVIPVVPVTPVTPVIPGVPIADVQSVQLISPGGATFQQGTYTTKLIANVVGNPIRVDFYWGGTELMESVVFPPYEMDWSLDPYWTPVGINKLKAVAIGADGSVAQSQLNITVIAQSTLQPQPQPAPIIQPTPIIQPAPIVQPAPIPVQGGVVQIGGISSAYPGDVITVSLVNNPSGAVTDWLSLAMVGEAYESIRGWVYTNGQNVVNLQIPSDAIEGQYEIRLFSADSYDLVDASPIFLIGSGGSSSSGSGIGSGILLNGQGGEITVSQGEWYEVTVLDGPGNVQDWIGLFPLGLDGDSVSWDDGDIGIGGTDFVPAPFPRVYWFHAPYQPGQYSVKVFYDGTTAAVIHESDVVNVV
jgi:hypothetical protein